MMTKRWHGSKRCCGRCMTSGNILPSASTLRLAWPQYQGATRENIVQLVPEIGQAHARKGYAVGSRVRDAVLPEHHGPTAVVPMPDTGDEGMTNGIESRGTVMESLKNALELIREHDADRILTLGGECSVSVAPFAALAEKYGDDLAVLWVDAHPDVDTPETGYDGYHAMAVSHLLGHGDPEIAELLPATVDSSRVALVGLHDWTEDAYEHVGQWGLQTFAPDDVRASRESLLAWIRSTGCSKVAIHIDVDVVDGDEIVLGLGVVPGGLTRAQLQRLVADVSKDSEVVGLTVAEFIPRSLLATVEMLEAMPLIQTDGS